MVITYLKLIIYLTEYHLMRLVAVINGWSIGPLPKLTTNERQTINNSFKALLSEWKLVLKDFPKANEITNPLNHLNRYILILKDLRSFLERKKRKDSHDISTQIVSKNCPEYFKRNYHYQTDGYFTFQSAQRYDHQIELLFLGSGHIMRKVAYSILKPVLPPNASVLEFGAGPGTSGKQFKQLFPNIYLDLLEPSEAYLKHAKLTYPGLFNQFFTEFMERFDSPKKYDSIFSCFVMHEIPLNQWSLVADKIKASLKTGGHLLLVDSQQNCDRPEHQFALDQFAEDFYEPYFQEFRENSLEEYFQKQGFKLVTKREVLFSKSLLFVLQS